ncbi:MAG: hypothetical protein AAGE43_20525 [Pseudomonadota bacterium]
MRKDYQFLIGQRFSVDGVTYVVRELTAAEDRTYVEARSSEQESDARDNRRRDPHPQHDSRTFTLRDVIESLVVDEEIELFNPNYLAAR